MLKQKSVRQHLARMLHQNPQNIILLGREFHLAILHLDDAPDKIDRKVTCLKYRPFPLALQAVAQGDADAGDKLVHAERLGDVIIRS